MIVKFKKLESDNFQISLNILNMENYIDILRCILKNFNIRKNKKFDTTIKYIINKTYHEYFHNRHKSKYCIDNLISIYSMKYFFIQRKYGTVRSNKLIYRFNRYSKRNYIKNH